MAFISTAVALVNAKKYGAAFLSFALKHWKEIFVACLLLYTAHNVACYLYDKGRMDSHKEWVSKYNESVSSFNKALREVRKDSTEIADDAEDTGQEISGKLEDIDENMRRLAEEQKKNRPPANPSCPRSTIDLNSTLSPEFINAWNAQSDAASNTGVRK